MLSKAIDIEKPLIVNKATEKNQIRIDNLCMLYDLLCNMHTCEEI